jgi:hypothetical protein
MKDQTKLTFVADSMTDFRDQRLARVIITGSFDYIFAELDRLEALQSAI